MSLSPQEFARLPKYAQAEIKDLEAQVDRLRTALHSAETIKVVPDSSLDDRSDGQFTWRDRPLYGQRVDLPPGRVTVRHAGMCLDVVPREDGVEINAYDSLTIDLRAGNSFLVRPQR